MLTRKTSQAKIENHIKNVLVKMTSTQTHSAGAHNSNGAGYIDTPVSALNISVTVLISSRTNHHRHFGAGRFGTAQLLHRSKE